MTTTIEIPDSAYPVTFSTQMGTEVTLRPMLPTDKLLLVDFFKKVPEEDRYYLKEDVTSADVIKAWTGNLDYKRALPIVAVVKGRIVADGTLHYHRAGARRHIGEVRIVVDPAYRKQGVGRRLLTRLSEIAREEGLDKLMFEIVADTEEAAKRAARAAGFVPVSILPDHVRDFHGNFHDLITMELRLVTPEPEEYLAY